MTQKEHMPLYNSPRDTLSMLSTDNDVFVRAYLLKKINN